MLSSFRLCFFALALSIVCAARQPSEKYFSVPGPDAPELAHRGPYSVGVRTVEIVHKNQVDILRFNQETGKAPVYDRPLTLEIWYPAVIGPGQQERTVYTSAMAGRPERQPAGTPSSFQIPGKALRDAPPVNGQRFPLVIVSHGYPGSRTFLTYLTENLTSKGYVVAAIDHTDSVFGAIKGFPSTLLNRSGDQLFTIEAITQLSQQAGNFLNGLVDASNVAIVGYSMGGYGALTSAGAAYSPSSPLQKFVPGNYLADWTAGSANFQSLHREAIKAIVAIAPWGEQPPYSAWDAQGLAGIRIPSLFIAGDHDDVANYAEGIKPAFQQAVNSERYLLVYENARHNTGGNPPPADVALSYPLLESFDEPVWRKDRITAINQHFITAFLDLYLKRDQSRREYLDVAPAHSDDGKWTAPADAPGDQFSSGKDQQGEFFWKGFQRRWALGLEMYRYRAGEAAN